MVVRDALAMFIDSTAQEWYGLMGFGAGNFVTAEDKVMWQLGCWQV